VTDRRRDGNPCVPSRESLLERQIRAAIDEGAFDELPYQGERLPLEDDSAAGEWALAHRMLRNAGMAPPWIETDKAVRSLLERIDRAVTVEAGAGGPGRARRRETLVSLVHEANAAISRLNAEAPTVRQHRRLLDAAEVLDRFDRRTG